MAGCLIDIRWFAIRHRHFRHYWLAQVFASGIIFLLSITSHHQQQQNKARPMIPITSSAMRCSGIYGRDDSDDTHQTGQR